MPDGCGMGRGKSATTKVVVGLTDQRFTRETHSGAPRRSGAPLAATNGAPAEVSCKRRDAVRLEEVEAALPPAAVFGVSSGATSSLAAASSLRPKWCSRTFD